MSVALLEGKVIVVTGGGRGIGAAICRELAAHGASVVVNYHTSAGLAEGVVDDVVHAGGEAVAIQADVRNAAEVADLLAQTERRLGRVSGVVNNAIAGVQQSPFATASWQNYEMAYEFGCHAVVNTIRAALPYFEHEGGGRVVNIVTEVWTMGPEGWSVYLAGKGAMVGVSRALARELGPRNVTVNMVAPGWMATDEEDFASAASRHMAEELPLRRRGWAAEIGKACVFFMSDLSSFVTGAFLPVNGGRTTSGGF